MRHGNEDTIREMLRVKRSVQAMYNTQFTAHLIAQQTQLAENTAQSQASAGENAMREMAAAMEAEKPVKRPDQVSFVKGDTLVQTHNADAVPANPDEINLDDDDEEEEDKGSIVVILQFQSDETGFPVFTRSVLMVCHFLTTS